MDATSDSTPGEAVKPSTENPTLEGKALTDLRRFGFVILIGVLVEIVGGGLLNLFASPISFLGLLAIGELSSTVAIFFAVRAFRMMHSLRIANLDEDFSLAFTLSAIALIGSAMLFIGFSYLALTPPSGVDQGSYASEIALLSLGSGALMALFGNYGVLYGVTTLGDRFNSKAPEGWNSPGLVPVHCGICRLARPGRDSLWNLRVEFRSYGS
ncbi:MAG: hypothetical protein OK452_01510 [Thaumarchaeota archaeon]|nr:hypothetical protein [Nitrososphaerota archaeon]